jgi:hypothetical protein
MILERCGHAQSWKCLFFVAFLGVTGILCLFGAAFGARVRVKSASGMSGAPSRRSPERLDLRASAIA